MKKLFILISLTLLLVGCEATVYGTINGEIKTKNCNQNNYWSNVTLDNGVTISMKTTVVCRLSEGVLIEVTHDNVLRVIDYKILEGSVENE